MLALLVTAFVSVDFPLPDHPALITRIGSPAFRHAEQSVIQAVSPNGTRIYTATFWSCSHASVLDTIFVWDARSGKLLNTYNPNEHGGHIRHYCFAADGLRVVSSWREENDQFPRGSRQVLRVLNPDTGELIRQGKPWETPREALRKFSSYQFNAVRTLPADNWLVHDAEKEQVVIDAATGKVVSFSPAVPLQKGSIAVAPDGQTALVRADDGKVRLFDLPTAEVRAEWTETADCFIDGFTANGKSVIIWEKRRTGWALELWTTTGLDRQTILDKRFQPEYARFSPNGKTFTLAVWRPNRTFSHVEVRETATGKLLLTLPWWVDSIQTEFSSDGRVLWTMTDGVLVPWDVYAGKLAANAPSPPASILRFRFLAEYKLVGLSGGDVITWSLPNGREVSRVPIPSALNLQENGNAFTPDGKRFFYREPSGHFTSWDFQTGEKTRILLPTQGPPNLPEQRPTPDGRLLLTRREDRLSIYRATDGKKILERPALKAEDVREWPGSGAECAIDSAGKRLAVARYLADSFTLLDLTDAKSAETTIRPGCMIEAIALSSDNRFIAVTGLTSWDKSGRGPTPLTVWETTTMCKVANVSLPAEDSRALSFSPDGRTLAIAFPRRLVLVDVKTWKVKASVRCDSRNRYPWMCEQDTFAWSPSGKLLAVQTSDARLAVWDVTKLEGK